mmetsp:Transcript_26255/g.39022  ORF Transcript_26255/g.39022 Transcript_26255/m.39022 type:complete len:256 (+) Transcript_26255:1-768(+)
MSGIETKSPGFFTRSIRERKSRRRGFDTDRLIFKDDEVSYALGKDGATRKKLEVASGAILQYVGYVAFIAGTRRERRRCREFVMWLLQQRRGSVTIDDISRRDDVTEVHVPTSCKGWVTGNRGSELRRIEQATGTYIFMALDGRGEERLLVFGVNPGSAASRRDGGRAEAELLIKELVHDKMMDDERYGRDRDRDRDRDRRSSRSRSYSRNRGGGSGGGGGGGGGGRGSSRGRSDSRPRDRMRAWNNERDRDRRP